RPGTALAYLAATLLAALAAVWLAATTARRMLRTGPTATREKGKRPS
ncbi:MAG TPA: fluoride efflux transporter CrcB, partial [Streptomyces sp.]|nr:fluoride efflux transporter CrcB [Streptomyces sp.]